jgi:hypothetical protein
MQKGYKKQEIRNNLSPKLNHLLMSTFRSLLFISLVILSLSSCEKDDFIENKVPKADAGPTKTITLPVNSLTVTGTGTDEDGQVVAYLWSQVSGPEATIIVNPGAAATDINGFVEGNYVFQLMVTDNKGATGVDTVSIKVNPAIQQTVTLQPTNNPNEKMLIVQGGTDISAVGRQELTLDAWTVGGSPWYGRAAIKFDLSNIPSNATILSANLFLYSNTPPQAGNFIDANFGTNNALLLQQITSNWTPATATWNNQPSVSTVNQIGIPHTALSALDINVDVKGMVSSMVKNNANYGFFLRLENETIYTSRMFVSSFHPTKADKHPKLVVIYE